jgi:hypothetical protein
MGSEVGPAPGQRLIHPWQVEQNYADHVQQAQEQQAAHLHPKDQRQQQHPIHPSHQRCVVCKHTSSETNQIQNADGSCRTEQSQTHEAVIATMTIEGLGAVARSVTFRTDYPQAHPEMFG